MNKAWWKEAVVYQVYTRSFFDTNNDGIGDLPGVLEKIDYLKDLGVNVLWLNPVYRSPNDDNGYDIADYRSIHPEYGTMEDWEKLLEAAHERGMKLIMDLVINHTSDEHPWFIASKASRENPYRDYYIWRDGNNSKAPNNWASFFEGSAWEWDEKTEQYYLHLFSKKQPDLNWDNPKVEDEVFNTISWWLDKGIDGFRMDVINLLKKPEGLPDSTLNTDFNTGLALDIPLYTNNEGMHQILKRLNKKVLSKYDLFTVGEVLSVEAKEALEYVGEDSEELQMLIHFDLALAAKDWKLSDIKRIILHWYSVVEGGGWTANYLSNHDQPRQVSIFGDDKQYRKESAKMLALFNHTVPGTPFIHQGEEIGMTNDTYNAIEDFRDIQAKRSYQKRVASGEDPAAVIADLQKFSRDNGRKPMHWNSSTHGGFSCGEPWISVNSNYQSINVEQSLKDPDSILGFYKAIIALRKKHPVIVYGDFNLLFESHDSLFCFKRTYKNVSILVLLNFSTEKVSLDTSKIAAFSASKLLLANYKEDNALTTDSVLRPYEARLYLLENKRRGSETRGESKP